MAQDDLSRPINELIAAFDEQERILRETIVKAADRLQQVAAARMALLALESDEPLPFDGKLADAIRVVLKAKNRSLVPVEVRDQVKALGYDFKEHKNQMAAVHGVLKRMVESGEAKNKWWAKQPGIARYYWSGWDTVVPPGNVAVTEPLKPFTLPPPPKPSDPSLLETIRDLKVKGKLK